MRLTWGDMMHFLDPRHNYVRRMREMGERGETDGTLGLLYVHHDDGCAVRSGGFCDCDCVIEFIPENGDGQGTDGRVFDVL